MVSLISRQVLWVFLWARKRGLPFLTPSHFPLLKLYHCYFTVRDNFTANNLKCLNNTTQSLCTLPFFQWIVQFSVFSKLLFCTDVSDLSSTCWVQYFVCGGWSSEWEIQFASYYIPRTYSDDYLYRCAGQHLRLFTGHPVQHVHLPGLIP